MIWTTFRNKELLYLLNKRDKKYNAIRFPVQINTFIDEPVIVVPDSKLLFVDACTTSSVKERQCNYIFLYRKG